MSEHHVVTSAAVSDDVEAPRHPRARERQLLLALAVTASLPRVLWGLTLDAMRLFGEAPAELEPLYAFMGTSGLLLNIACLVLIGLLHPLDGAVPGTKNWRVAALVIGGFELGLTSVPLGSLLFSAFGQVAWLIWTVPKIAASLVFAMWLAALLKSAGKTPMLVIVVIAAAVIQALTQLVFGGMPLVYTLVGVLVAVEVLRARRAIEEPTS